VTGRGYSCEVTCAPVTLKRDRRRTEGRTGQRECPRRRAPKVGGCPHGSAAPAAGHGPRPCPGAVTPAKSPARPHPALSKVSG